MPRSHRRFASLFAKNQRRLGLSVEQLEPRVLMTSNPGVFTMRDFLASALERTFQTASLSSPLAAPGSIALASPQLASPSSRPSSPGTGATPLSAGASGGGITPLAFVNPGTGTGIM